MAQSHVPAPGSRDPNDEKVMVNSVGNEPGRKIEASNTTLNSYENSPIDAYYSFPSSNTVAVETYSKRVDALVEKLGNKDEVKG